MCLCILFVGHLFKNRDIKESSFSLSALTTRLYDIYVVTHLLVVIKSSLLH